MEAVGAGRISPLRPGKMVPGGITSPVGTRLLLAKGRYTGLERWNLLADVSKDYGFGISEAETFIRTLADILGVSRDYILESYEDISIICSRNSSCRLT